MTRRSVVLGIADTGLASLSRRLISNEKPSTKWGNVTIRKSLDQSATESSSKSKSSVFSVLLT